MRKIADIAARRVTAVAEALAEAAREELPGDVSVSADARGVVITGRRLVARAWGRFADPRFRGLLPLIRGRRR